MKFATLFAFLAVTLAEEKTEDKKTEGDKKAAAKLNTGDTCVLKDAPEGAAACDDEQQLRCGTVQLLDGDGKEMSKTVECVPYLVCQGEMMADLSPNVKTTCLATQLMTAAAVGMISLSYTI